MSRLVLAACLLVLQPSALLAGVVIDSTTKNVRSGETTRSRLSLEGHHLRMDVFSESGKAEGLVREIHASSLFGQAHAS